MGNNYTINSTVYNNNNFIVYMLIIYFLAVPLSTVPIFDKFGSILRLLALLPIVAIILKRGFKYRLTKLSILQLIYSLFLLFSVIYSIDVKSTIVRFNTNILFFILLFMTSSINFKKFDIVRLKNALIWSSRIMCFIVLLFGSSSIESFGRVVLTSGLVKEDPNYINGYLLFGVINSLEILLNKNSIRLKIFALLELFIYFYVSFLTGSRGGLLAIVASFAIYFLIYIINSKRIRYYLRSLIFLSITLLLIYLIISLLPNDLLSRFEISNIIQGRASKRFDIWENSFYIFKYSNTFNKLFGFGAGTIQTIFGSLINLKVVAHNIFIEQLLEVGIFGLLLYMLFIFHTVKKSVKEQDYFSTAVIIGFIVLSLSTSLYGFKPYWNAIIFVGLFSLQRFERT